MKKLLLQSTVLSLAVSVLSLNAATTKYWDINGATAGSGQGTGTGTWNTSTANWSTDPAGGIAATTFASGDLAVFSAGTDATSAWTVNLPSGLTAGSLTVEEGTVTKTGSALTTQTIVVSNGAGFFINAALALTVSTAGGTCTLYGGTVGNANTGTGSSFFGSSTANANMGLVLSGGGHVSANGGANIVTIYTGLISGTGPLTVDGNGIFRLTTTTATYSGATIINGWLQLSTTANVLPSTTDMTINSGGTFDDEATQTIGSLSGSGTLKFLNSATVLTSSNASDTSFSGPVTGTGSFTKVGAGTLTISGNHWNNTGTNNINGGTIKYGDSATGFSANSLISIGASGTLDMNSFDDTIGGLSGSGIVTNNSGATGLHVGGKNISTTFSGVISGTGNLEKVGTASQALTGNNTYTGNTTISSGTVSVNGTVLTPFGIGGTLFLAGGAVACTADRGVSANNLLNPVVLTANSEIVQATATGTRNFVFGGPLSGTAGTLTIHDTGTAAGPTTNLVRFTNTFSFTRPITFLVDTPSGHFINLDIWNRVEFGDQTYSGLISGPGSIKRSSTTGNTGGRVIFTAQNTFAGPVFLNDGEIALGSDCTGVADAPTAGPVGIGIINPAGNFGKVSAYGAARVLLNRFVFSSGGRQFTLTGSNDLQLAGSIDLGGVSTSCIFTNNNTGASSISGVISDGNFGKAGPSTLTLTAANTFTNCAVAQGTLALLGFGSLGSSATASNFVAAGATLDVTGRTDGTLTIGPGQTLAGGGTVQGIVNLSGSISPGASPGTLATGPSTWNGGATYNWQINNATNTSGADPGWDLVSVAGGLNLNAAASNKIILNIASLTSTNTSGSVETFDSTSNYVWTIVTTTQGVTNFDVNAFALDRSSFSNSLGNGTFTLALANSGKDIQLVFAPDNAPVVTAPGDVTMSESSSTNVTATATDADSPTTLTFSLTGSPAFASIDASSGVITLSPGAGTAGDYTVNVVATDDASTPASGTNSFVVHVISTGPANPPYSISSVSVTNTTVYLSWQSVNGIKYQVIGSTDLSAPIGSWTNVGGVVTAGGSTASQTDVLGPTQTFYQVKVVP